MTAKHEAEAGRKAEPIVDIAEVQRALDKAAEKVRTKGPQDGRVRRPAEK